MQNAKEDTRVKVVGWGTVALAVYGVIASAGMILAFLGFGGLIAFSGNGISGFFSGVGFGLFGALLAVVGVLLSLGQGLVGLMILNGKRAGWGWGLALGILGVLAWGSTGAWLWAGWSAFTVWALLSTSRKFR